MAYGYTITAVGRTLLLQLQAGNSMTISRIAVGDGEVPDGMNPATLTNLVREVERSHATCTTPIVESDTLSFDIEYRNKWDDGTFGSGYTDPEGLAESFWLREYGVFALDAHGDEIMLYYANLGEFPEPVARWTGRNLVSKRYPVEISIVDDSTDVQLNFPANAFITSEYLEERLTKTTVLSRDLPTGTGWTLWLQITGEVEGYPEPGAPPAPLTVELDTAPLDAPGDFAVLYDDESGETMLNMTDDPDTAGDDDIIVVLD